jgi:hypothetical protein
MNRSHRARISRVSVAAAFVAASAYACLALPAVPADYWPMKKGNSWTLDTDAGGRKMTQIATVTDVKREGSATLATLDYKANGQSINTEVYRITAETVERMSGGPNGSIKMSPPIVIVRAPMKAGQTWKWSGAISPTSGTAAQNVKATSTLKVSGPETIKNKAGTFQAMRVHSELVVEAQGKKLAMPNDYWFAPKVGIVRQTATINNMQIEGTLTQYTVK